MSTHKKTYRRKVDGGVADVFTAKLSRRRSVGERWADLLTAKFGSIAFFVLNAFFFLVWIGVNQGLVAGVPVFDPYPYGLLTMIVSLEAIFLSVVVLISQNRAAKNADLREEIDFQVNVQAEREITKMLSMLVDIEKHLNIAKQRDQELMRMKESLSIADLEKRIRKSIDT